MSGTWGESWTAIIVDLHDLLAVEAWSAASVLPHVLTLLVVVAATLYLRKLLKDHAVLPPHASAVEAELEAIRQRKEDVELVAAATEEVFERARSAQPRPASTVSSVRKRSPRARARHKAVLATDSRRRRTTAEAPPSVAAFLAAHVIARPGGEIGATDFYNSYCERCEGEPVSKAAFFRAASATYPKREGRDRNYYLGIGIRGDRSGIGAVN